MTVGLSLAAFSILSLFFFFFFLVFLKTKDVSYKLGENFYTTKRKILILQDNFKNTIENLII